MMKHMIIFTGMLFVCSGQLVGAQGSGDSSLGLLLVAAFGFTAYTVQKNLTSSSQASFVVKSGQQSRTMHTSVLGMHAVNSDHQLGLFKPTPTSITHSISQNSLQEMVQTQVPFSKDSSPVSPASPRLSTHNSSALQLTSSSSSQELEQVQGLRESLTPSPAKDVSRLQSLKSPEPGYDIVDDPEYEIINGSEC